jgi:hypothetical protein
MIIRRALWEPVHFARLPQAWQSRSANPILITALLRQSIAGFHHPFRSPHHSISGADLVGCTSSSHTRGLLTQALVMELYHLPLP